MDDAVRALRGRYVADGKDVGRQALLLPGLAVIVGECNVCAIFVNVFFLVGIEVGDKEEPPGSEADHAGPLAAPDGSNGVFDFTQVLPPSELVARGMRPSMAEFLPPKPRMSPLRAITMRCVPARGAPAGVVPGLAVVVRGPHGRDGAIAVVIAARGVGGNVNGSVFGAHDGVDGLRNVAADGRGEMRELNRRPGCAVVVGGGVGEWRRADEARKSPEEPETAMIVPEDRSGASSIGKIGPRFRHVPIFSAGAAAHDHDGLVGIVFLVGRVVVGRDDVAVRKNLNGRVVIVDAKTGRKTHAPTDVRHRLAVEIREQLVHVIEGLGRIGTCTRDRRRSASHRCRRNTARRARDAMRARAPARREIRCCLRLTRRRAPCWRGLPSA